MKKQTFAWILFKLQNIKKDGVLSHEITFFVHQYGCALIDLIEGENLSILDLGCGNGALTKNWRIKAVM